MTKYTLKNIGALPYDSDKQGYVIRFRVVSQDKNRTSAWSTFYTAKVPASMLGSESVLNLVVPSATAMYTSSLGGSVYLVTFTWSDSSSNALTGLAELDVYTRQSSTWGYRGRMKINNSTNIAQYIFDTANGTAIRFSFHRPSTLIVTSGQPPVTTRLFVVDKTIP